jgi:hypothetical protein
VSDRKSVHITERKPRRMSPRSLANLRAPWQKGESGNLEGRPSAGGAVKEYLNAMQELTLADVKLIIDDPNQPINRVAAARLWMDACTHTSDLTVLMIHTEGKPKETIDVQAEVTHSIKPAMERLRGNPKAFEAALALSEELSDDGPTRN